MPWKTLKVWGFACVLTAAPPARTQTAEGARIDVGAQRMLTSRDIQFAVRAAQSGLAEIQLGKMAAEKASDPDLRAFGQQMVDDHTKANDQLSSVTHQAKMTLPDTMNARDQATYDRLSQLSGTEFDKAYAADMVRDHERDVKEFHKEVNNGKDPKIRNFASQTLPVLQRHLDKIEYIAPKVNGSSAKGTW